MRTIRKTITFTGKTREEVEKKIEAWRAAHRGVKEIDFHLSESGTPSGRFAPKSLAKEQWVSATITYEGPS